MLLIIVVSLVADVTRVTLGSRLSKRPFAKYVAPDMYLDGVVISLVMASLTTYGMWIASQKGMLTAYVLPLDRDTYLIFG